MIVYSGAEFNLRDLGSYSFPIVEIAHALSMQCRFNGHTRVHYSVAQHAVLVSHFVRSDFALEALMHDAAEAYLGDMVYPLKQQVPNFCAHEEAVLRAIFAKHKIEQTEESKAAVHRIDQLVLHAELRDLFSVQPAEPIHVPPIVPVTQEEAKLMFMHRYASIGTGVGTRGKKV